MSRSRTRVKTVRSASRRITRRLAVERPGQIVLVAIICAIALTSSVVAHLSATGARDALERVATLRHGAVAVVATASDDRGQTRWPALSRVRRNGGNWLNESAARAVEREIRALGGRPYRRVEFEAYASDGSIRTVVAAAEDDPGLRLAASTANEASFAVAVRVRSDGPVSWRTIPPSAVYGVDNTRDGAVWVRLDWVMAIFRLLPASPSGTRIASHFVVTPAIPAGETAFSFAFELSERLSVSGLAVESRPWPQIIGHERYVAAGSTAALLTPLALTVASVAVAGAVAVAVRNRAREAVLLRTVGFETGVIRGLHVREIGLASCLASSLVLVGILVASALGADVTVDVQIRRTLVGGALLPPLIAFLTARRQLRAPLARVRREADL